MDLSTLVQKIQEERSAVALNIFLKRSATDDLQDLQKYVTNGMDIRRFTLIQVRIWNAANKNILKTVVP